MHPDIATAWTSGNTVANMSATYGAKCSELGVVVHGHVVPRAADPCRGWHAADPNGQGPHGSQTMARNCTKAHKDPRTRMDPEPPQSRQAPRAPLAPARPRCTQRGPRALVAKSQYGRLVNCAPLPAPGHRKCLQTLARAKISHGRGPVKNFMV